MTPEQERAAKTKCFLSSFRGIDMAFCQIYGDLDIAETRLNQVLTNDTGAHDVPSKHRESTWLAVAYALANISMRKEFGR